ncbi:MAG TPA: glycosyltransferase family 4 protein [Bryobacteraceae bacterium]|jgi:glycosyltransferase involved in cell wall biosynthesis|nr:glycosyltransferase family 4 protein [Bryobacteraceae bacterium]
MNILFLDQFSDLGGAQRCLLDLLPAVRERGWQAHLAAPGAGEMRRQAAAHGAELHSILCGPYDSGRKSVSDFARFIWELPRLGRQIATLAERTRASIVYVNGPRLLPAASLSSTPLVFHCHSYLLQRYAAALAGVALAGAQVIGSCRFVLEPLRLFVEPRRMEVVYNGCAAGEYPARPARARPTIGMIGRMAPEKGQLEFLQAVRLLPPDFRFILCGAPLFSNPAAEAYYERVREAAVDLPVEFQGWRNDIGAALTEMDLLVVPSAPVEATTRVILEAYAAGVPVVATRSGGIPEIVEDGVTGFLAPPGDPAKLAARISAALADPDALRSVAGNARRVWRERFTLAEYQNRVLSILERVGASARR